MGWLKIIEYRAKSQRGGGGILHVISYGNLISSPAQTGNPAGYITIYPKEYTSNMPL